MMDAAPFIRLGLLAIGATWSIRAVLQRGQRILAHAFLGRDARLIRYVRLQRMGMVASACSVATMLALFAVGSPMWGVIAAIVLIALCIVFTFVVALMVAGREASLRIKAGLPLD